MVKNLKKKKELLKAMIKDGAGGRGFGSLSTIGVSQTKPLRVRTGAITSTGKTTSSDNAFIAPYKNAYYKRAKANQAFGRVAKLTGLDG